jgi:phage terminase small subunit
MPDPNRPPRHLNAAARRLWTQVLADYDLEAHHRELLLLALEAMTRGDQARREIERSGILIRGRWGPTVNPAVAIERNCQATYLRLMRELSLDSAAEEAARPPMIRGGARYGRRR